jgi:hypothetical protein
MKMSSFTFQRPSDCFFQTTTNFPFSVVDSCLVRSSRVADLSGDCEIGFGRVRGATNELVVGTTQNLKI